MVITSCSSFKGMPPLLDAGMPRAILITRSTLTSRNSLKRDVFMDLRGRQGHQVLSWALR